MFASPEDVIPSKLKVYRDGRSQKHLHDFAAMMRVPGDRLDRASIDPWPLRTGVATEWPSTQDRRRSGQP
jgi:hypothetical protein